MIESLSSRALSPEEVGKLFTLAPGAAEAPRATPERPPGEVPRKAVESAQ